MKFFLNPGHGGADPGSVSNGLKEKDITLLVSMRIRDILLNEYENIEIKMSRTDDRTVSLKETTDMANAWGADFFLSIHVNAGGGKGGFESFIYHKIPAKDLKETERVQQLIHAEVMKLIGGIDRGPKKKDLHVCRETEAIAVLTEMAFIDVANDAARLKDPRFLENVARGHANGVALAFGLKKKTALQKTPILGESKAAIEQMIAFVKEENPQFDEEIAKAFLEVGRLYGIRGDIAFCQSIHETGWFKFEGGTAVTPDQHNYCGLGVTKKGVKGAAFSSIREGVTAQIQHLYAYATKADLPTGEKIVDPRFHLVTRGIAPAWEDLNGRWAVPGTTYGQSILALHDKLLKFPIPIRKEEENKFLDVTFIVNGNPIPAHYMGIPTKGYIQDGRAYIPIRPFAELVGLKVAYEPKDHSISLNGRKLKTKTILETEKRSTGYCQVKEIADLFKYKLAWDQSTKTVTVVTT
ncbi:N-acetylmuramoyl-L-alanine amidase [Brevibacillus migulae]|uniref:N-acetylmuramoyl-L-alanine amidase n=1 Tax=Brevibacillus migulae TaxID=1644114 RepID=UPI00106E3CB0|nr:N-acetylmuramoyl-L-alanine amidase [Brevibacillus migulae]